MLLSTRRISLGLLLLGLLAMTVSSTHQPRGTRKAIAVERNLQVVAARKMKGSGGSDEEAVDNPYWSVEGAEGDPDEDWSEEESKQESKEESQAVDEGKGKGKAQKGKEKDEDDDDETDDGETGGEIIESAEESMTPVSDAPNTESPTVEASESTPVDFTLTPTDAPSFSATVSLTETPVVETESPTFAPVTQDPAATAAPVASESTQGPTFTTSTENQPTGETPTGGDGTFDGEDYYHHHLVPFAVSVEGDDVTNDLGITSCLLTEMQRNMSSLLNLEMENFTIVEFADEDGDGFKRFELYFSGFSEFVGLPVYSEAYAQEVQINVMGDGVEFYQNCLDARWGDSDKSYTASKLDHDQATQDHHDGDVDGLQGNEYKSSVGDDDDKLETNLIIGLVVAGAVVGLCGIIFASRLLMRSREPEAENSKLLEQQQQAPEEED